MMALAVTRTKFNDRELAWEAAEEQMYESVFAWPRRLRICSCQGWRCCYCGVRMFAGDRHEDLDLYMMEAGLRRWSLNDWKRVNYRAATIEHVMRRAEGGSDEDSNLVGACLWCNSNRHERPASVWFAEVQALIALGRHPHGGERLP